MIVVYLEAGEWRLGSWGSVSMLGRVVGEWAWVGRIS